jgi:hypothetical protein
LPTVKNHVHHVLEKLGARRRGEAAHRLRWQERKDTAVPSNCGMRRNSG